MRIHGQSIQEKGFVNVFAVVIKEFAFFFCADSAIKSHGVVIVKNLVVLNRNDVLNGVGKPHRRNQQSRAAADSENHHEKSFLVTENVSKADLVQKFQLVPDKRNSFQQNTLSECRSLRPDEFSRNIYKFRIAAVNRRARTASNCCENG